MFYPGSASISSGAMAVIVVEKIRFRLKFLYRTNNFLNVSLFKLYVLVQLYVDYACVALYSNLTN